MPPPWMKQPARPDWWPEGEAWPPQPHGWTGSRQRFIRRIGCFIALIFLVIGIANAFVFQTFNERGNDHKGPPWPLGIVVFLIIVVVIGVLSSRFIRRSAMPIGDVMDAADRVAAGDYSVQVRPRGSPEVQRLAVSFNEMTSRLQANEEQRRQLLADVAHELRTPLSVVRGNLEGMVDGIYPRDDRHLTEIIDQTEHIARLLEDLRTLSLAEAGTLRLFPEPTSIGELIATVVAAFRAKADSVAVSLVGRVDQTIDIEVDPTRLREIIDNLVTNALRYTPASGSITIEANQHAAGVTVSVTDTGTGIAPDLLPHLFERFTKSTDSGGSGLGLAIAKRLVEAHGGEIRGESTPGKGTRIQFTIPMKLDSNRQYS